MHRTELPKTADGVFDLEINLGAVERCFAFDALVFNFARIKSRRQSVLCFLPLFIGAQKELVRVASLHRQFELNFIEAERLQDLISKVHAIIDLARNLFWSTKQVRIVNRESAYAHQSVQRARQLSAIDRAHFAITLRKIAIGSLLGFVDADVHRAIHWLETKLSLFQLRRRKH